MKTSKDISREFNRRIFINQMKQDRDSAGQTLTKWTMLTLTAFCFAAWLYIIWGLLSQLLK